MEEEFNKGFNQGYILNKYSKDVAEKVSKSFQGENEYVLGFNEGEKEASLEVQKDKLDQLNDLRNNKDNELDKER